MNNEVKKVLEIKRVPKELIKEINNKIAQYWELDPTTDNEYTQQENIKSSLVDEMNSCWFNTGIEVSKEELSEWVFNPDSANLTHYWWVNTLTNHTLVLATEYDLIDNLIEDLEFITD